MLGVHFLHIINYVLLKMINKLFFLLKTKKIKSGDDKLNNFVNAILI